MFFTIDHIINDKYKIIDWIGEGGFGEVYKIQDLASNEVKALKCLIPQFVEDNPEYADLFAKEAKATMQVENMNVVEIFSIEETVYRDYQVKFFTMEYAEEGDLDKYLKQQETYLYEEKLLDWMKQLLLGLKAVNEKIIHRDIKPKNILIFGEVLKISDFGLSRFIEESTRTLTFKGMGTPLYMAPEIWEKFSSTILVDQYSMGMVFYVLATLKHPFLPIPSNVNHNEFLKENHLFTMPKEPKKINPELPEKLNSLIMRMVEKNDKNRYQSLDEILDSLENIKASENQVLPSSLVEIVKEARKTEQKVKKEELRIVSERKKQEEALEKIEKIFIFHCKELLSLYDKIIDNINAQIKPAKIKRFQYRNIPFYKLVYSFHDSSLKVLIDLTDRVNEVSDVIGWGYTYINKNEDGYNLLLQKSSDTPYAKWLSCTFKDHALLKSAKHFKPHAVTEIDKLNIALRGLRMMSIYDAELREFNEEMFIELVKQLVS